MPTLSYTRTTDEREHVPIRFHEAAHYQAERFKSEALAGLIAITGVAPAITTVFAPQVLDACLPVNNVHFLCGNDVLLCSHSAR